MISSLFLWRPHGRVDLEAAIAAYRRFARQESRRARPTTEGVVNDFLQRLAQVFPESGGEDSPWAQTPHSRGGGYVMLQVTTSRLPKVMNVVIPFAQQAGMATFVPSTNELYSPSDSYTPQLSLPSETEIEGIVQKLAQSRQPLRASDSVLDAVIGEVSAKPSETTRGVIRRGLEDIGFNQLEPHTFTRETETCEHLVLPQLRGSLDGHVTLSVSIGIRFEPAERIRAAADRPEMSWESKQSHPTVGCTLKQLVQELPRPWRIRSVEEARRSGARVLESIQEHAEPYFRKYSDPDVVLKALVNSGEDARRLEGNPYKRALTTVALAASLGDDQQLTDAIEKMRGFLGKKDPHGVRGFELFTEKLRSLTGPS